MLKSVSSLFFVLSSICLISNSVAAIHPEMPTNDLSAQEEYINLLKKEARCLDAFVRSDFEVARAICIPLANSGFTEAQLVTGLMYAFGTAVIKTCVLPKSGLAKPRKMAMKGPPQHWLNSDSNKIRRLFTPK